jgi:hypothetical protein
MQGVEMKSTHSSDSWKYPKRTVNKRHWRWLLQKRKSLFCNAIFTMFEEFHLEGKELLFDPASTNTLIDGPGWEGEFALTLKNWAFPGKPKNARHIRATLSRFLDWGEKEFKKAKYPWVPKMPDFQEFLKTRPFAKGASIKKGIRQ